MSFDILESLMSLNQGIPVAEGQPILQGENPLTSLGGLPPATAPAATAAPALAYNPSGKQVQSLEELLFGIGGGLGG